MNYLNNKLINKSELARLLGLSLNAVRFKIKGNGYHKFSSEQKAKIKEAIKDLYEESQKAE